MLMTFEKLKVSSLNGNMFEKNIAATTHREV